MEQTLRLFIAIDLPSEVKQLLHDLQQQLRQYTRAVRWADPHGTHLTLKFLGNVAPDQVDPIHAGMQAATAAQQPFTLQTGALGVFPNARRPRVIWLGLEAQTAALQTLQTAVERTIAPLGFPTEQRPFTPHLTLGRSMKSPTDAELATIAQAVARTNVSRHLSFEVREIVLMRSELTPAGARYTPIAHVPLAGTA